MPDLAIMDWGKEKRAAGFMVDGVSLSSPDLDSTSELLGNLDLIGRIVSDSLDMPDMDAMDVDLVLEVPDTPESVVRNRGSRFAAFNEDVRGLNSLSSDRRAGRARKTYGHQSRDSSSCDMVGTDNSQDETELLFRQARLARLLSEDRDGKASHPTFEHNVVSNGNGRSSNHQSDSHSPGHRDSRRRIEKELHPRHEGSGNFHLKHTDKGKGIVLRPDSKDKIKQTLLGGSPIDTHRNTGRRRLVVVHNGCTSPFGTAKSGISSVHGGQNNAESGHVQISSSTSAISSRNVKKQVDVDSDSKLKTGQLNSKHSEMESFPCRNGQRRLVRNGCIAPCNIKRDNSHTGIKGDDFGCNRDSEGSLVNEVHVISPDSSDRCADKRKGKAIMDDNVGASFQTSGLNSQSTRFCPFPSKEVISGGNPGCRSLKSSEDKLRGPAHNSQASVALSEYTTDFHMIENVNSKSHGTPRNRDCVDVVDGNPEIIAPCSEYNSNTARELSDLVSDDRSLGRHNLVRGKRKSSSIRANGGECSSSSADDAEVMFVRSSAQPTNQRSSRTRNTQLHGCSLLKPILEGDELDPANIRSGANPDEQHYRACEDSSAKARQVESDEILARQLQEQLFNESPVFEEMDATIALSLQQEENLQRAASFLRQGQPHPRNNSTAPVYAPPTRANGRSASARPTARSRIPASSRMAYLRSLNRPARDLETRLNFLEALEAEFDNRNRLNNVLQLQREFNENDYEMLLALDDNNEQAGASQRQINNLPQSVVQSENFEEACAVCLETPSIGDTIRHLPCLHKFHKDCIDSWLKRKTSCPICKCGIT
ncbi:Zinc finger RING/FYVE/PHD-type protein [Dioscorea alata]|uniref:Zinc finger RING/FYVE/PHD-type protein n=1 Tax=Dioscorea alata TaxID=55571 RepID=A0ACB7WTV2_DIOAL|nr:Zinc finger RING/FYVE/PHD-type protein [Dioscorea alata]